MLSFSRWLLLGEAVERAKPPDQVGRVEADDRPAGEAVAQDAQRSFVVGVAVRRNDDVRVADVKIRVTGREPLAARLDPARHRQLDDLERLAKPLAVLAQRPVVGIALVRLDCRDDRAGGDKTGDVVNMPVRVVALDAVAEPSDPLDTKMVA